MAFSIVLLCFLVFLGVDASTPLNLTFRPTSGQFPNLTALAPSTDGAVIFALGFSDQENWMTTHVSLDRGVKWVSYSQLIASGPPTRMIVGSEGRFAAFAGSNSVHTTRAIGQNWSLSVDLKEYVLDFMGSDEGSFLLVITASRKVHISSNFGKEWREPSEFKDLKCSNGAVSASGQFWAFSFEDNAFFSSDNFGKSFYKVEFENSSQFNRHARLVKSTLAFKSETELTVDMASWDCKDPFEMFSSDLGKTWSQATPPVGWPMSVSASALRGEFQLAITSQCTSLFNAALVQSGDGGRHWTPITITDEFGGVVDANVSFVDMSPSGKYQIAGTEQGWLVFSADVGVTWRRTDVTTEPLLASLFLEELDGKSVLVTTHGNVFASDDHWASVGAVPTPVTLSMFNMSALIGNTASIYLAPDIHLVQSDLNGNVNFMALPAGAEFPYSGRINFMIKRGSPPVSATMFLRLGDYVPLIWQTTNGGATWARAFDVMEFCSNIPNLGMGDGYDILWGEVDAFKSTRCYLSSSPLGNGTDLSMFTDKSSQCNDDWAHSDCPSTYVTIDVPYVNLNASLQCLERVGFGLDLSFEDHGRMASLDQDLLIRELTSIGNCYYRATMTGTSSIMKPLAWRLLSSNEGMTGVVAWEKGSGVIFQSE